MKIGNLEIIDLALFIPEESALIIADLHIGYEEALTKQGILIPKFHFKDLILRLTKILDAAKKKNDGNRLNLIIINGDLKHEFGNISDEEWRNTLKTIDFLGRYSKRLLLIKGNHDKILGPIAEKRNIDVVENVLIGDIMVLHGDSVPKDIPKNIKTIVIGHEHPAAGLHEGIRSETYKCFLVGKWKKYKLIVMPSMFQITEGTDVLKEKLLSPFLKQKLGNFDVFIVADEVYEFGKLKKLEKD